MFLLGVLVGVVVTSFVAFFICRYKMQNAYEQGLSLGKATYLKDLADKTGLRALLCPAPGTKKQGERGDAV